MCSIQNTLSQCTIVGYRSPLSTATSPMSREVHIEECSPTTRVSRNVDITKNRVLKAHHQCPRLSGVHMRAAG